MMIGKPQGPSQGQVKTEGFLLLVLVVLLLAVVPHPRYNGDLVGYVAAALSLTEADPETVHGMTYEAVRSHIPVTAYARLTDQSPHRRAIATSPHKLQEVIGIYRSRLVYVLPIHLLWRLGVPLPTAAEIVSVAMVCASACILYVLAGRGLAGAAVTGLSALAFGWGEIASYATADSAALCAALLLITALCKTSRCWWLVAVVCLFARTDLILLIALSIPVAPGSIRSRLALGVMLAGLYLLINAWFDYPGWQWQFANEFLHRGLPPDGPTGLTWRDYASVVNQNLPRLVACPSLAVMGLLGWLGRPVDRRWWSYCGIPLFFVGAHFLLYPAVYPRFFGWCGPVMTVRVMSLGFPRQGTGGDETLRAGDLRLNLEIPAPRPSAALLAAVHHDSPS